MPSAERAEFEPPERLILDRGLVGHVDRGLGTHFCRGAALAKLEADIAIPPIVRHFDTPELAPGALPWQRLLCTRALRKRKLIAR